MFVQTNLIKIEAGSRGCSYCRCRRDRRRRTWAAGPEEIRKEAEVEQGLCGKVL